MADINYVVGTSGDDVLAPTDGMNDYLGMGGNDTVDGSTGVNTIHYNSGDGVDTVKFALPRTYQFADFLTAAQNGLTELGSLGGASQYSNSYFASADSSLIGLLPADLADSIAGFQSVYSPEAGGWVQGSLDPAAAQAAFNSLINWINTSNSNVIQFGPGITLNNLNLQLGAMADLGTPQSTPTQFAVAVGSEQGVVFNLNGPPSVAGDSSSPPVIDLTFQFADGTSATLADLLARPNPGVMGIQNGSDDSELIRGSLGSDTIFGYGGNDVIDGGAGDDSLFGGDGNDVISGGSGYDTIYGEAGNDIMAAGKGGDPLTGAPPDFLSGGSGDDVYAFNRGDGGELGVTIDNADPDGSGMDTISFGKDVSRADLVASVDPSTGNLTLTVSGTTDHLTITSWFDVTTMAPNPDKVIDRVQFIDADGTAHVYDLASLVQAAFPNPRAADPSASVQLVGADATELPEEAAGGAAAIRYALTGSLLESSGNQAPIAAAVPNQTVLQDDPHFTYTLPAGTFSDPEGAALTLSATTANGQALPSWLNFDPVHGTFSGIPTNDDVGQLAIKVTATDPGGLSASQTFDLNVENVNDAPTATAGVIHVDFTEDQSLGYTLPNDTFNDVDGDALTYTATLENGDALPSWLHFNPTDRSLAGTPTNDDVGNLAIKVTATDPSGASASKSLSIDIANTNDAPTASAGVAVATATEDASFSYPLPAGTFTDVDGGDVLTYGAKMADGTALPSWLHIDPASGTLHGTPTNDDVGSLSVVVTATDKAQTSATKTVSISVANTNDAPTATAGVALATAKEDTSFTYTLPAGTFTDVDGGDVLTYGAKMADGSALPSWLQVDAASGTLHGTPTNDAVGNLSVVVTATDQAHASASKTVSISVANTNDAPTVAHAVADQTAVAGTPYSMVVPTNTFQDMDASDALTLSARLANGDPLPSWLHFDPLNRTLSGTAGAPGQWNIAVVATDLAGISVSDAFTLNVDAPTTTGTGKIINGTAGNDKLYGTAGNDDITGGKGKDLLSGAGGDDTLHVSADAKWGSGSSRTNAGTGEKVSISGKVRSYDVFDGGTGSDTLVGTSGGDAILLDDSKSSAAQKGPRIIGVEQINAGAGDDVVDLTSKRYSYGDVTIDGGSGNDVLWSSSGKDVLRGGSGNDNMDGGAGKDYLDGGSGNDKLNGGSGVDILQGGSGKDTLKDTSGNGVLDGGSGNDSLTEGSGNSLMIGGKGNDHLYLGGGYDVIAFNRGDGRDVVSSGKGGKSTLSLGGGISYQDLTLSRSGSDLILNIGSSDRITFEKWYDGRKYQAVSKLQVVAEAMPGFDAAGSDPLRDDKIETFDFKGLVKAFDTARSHSPGLSKWTLTNALAQFHLGGSDDAALGGDLAYQYGTNGTLVGIAANVAQDTAGSSQFGKQAQALHSQTELKDGLVKLS